jgi:hypothetical protein
MPARVQARDVEIMRRELNCNMVRCAHYPQAEAFYDACDELGLLAWEEAPGWGYLGDDAWKALAYRDIGEMIVRDRNHPSIIIWSARLNETPNDTAFYTSTNRLEVYVGGEHFATVMPDTAGYGHLPYPPSFADFRGVDGSSRPELRIDGYLGADRVASRSFSADPSGDVLALAADDAEIDGDGTDATRLEFRAVDRYGAPRPYVAGQVGFEVTGPAVLVGDNPFDFAAAGGAGAVWIRSRPGARSTVIVRASHPTLGQAVAQIRTR